ncbi:MAG: hypothetical protein ACTSQP_23710 [Promethearchaeota archaeon]
MMDINNVIIRNYEKSDASDLFNIYLDEYRYYYRFSSIKDINNKLLQPTTLAKIIEFNNEVIGAYIVDFEKKYKRAYVYGMILKKDFRGKKIFQKKISSIDNALNLFKSISEKFKDIDIIYALTRGYSHSAGVIFDLTKYTYNGVYPFYRLIKNKREPLILRILFPENNPLSKKFYNKKLLHLWNPPNVIPEIKEFVDIIIKFSKLNGESIINHIKLNSEIKPVNIKQNSNKLIHINIGDDYISIKKDPVNKSAKLEFHVNNIKNLKQLIKISLTNLKNYEYISANAHNIYEQRALYDFGFKPVAYKPLFDVKYNKRIDAIEFAKIYNNFDFSFQKEKLLNIQKGFKIRRLINLIYSYF